MLRTTLATDANRNYNEFLADYLDLAHSLCAFIYPSGLLHYVCTQAEWDAVHPPVLNAANVLAPVPYHANPTIPAALGANPTAAAISFRERQHKDYIEEVQAAQYLKESLLTAVGTDNCRLLEDPFTGTRLITCREIVERMRLEHGTATVATLTSWERDLDSPIDPTKPFSHLATTHRFINARLQAAGQPKSEFTKCMLLTAAVSLYPEYTKAIQDYNTATPVLALRTVAALSAYVTLHQPNTTVSSAGYAHAIMTPAMQSAVDAAVAQALLVARGGGSSSGRTGGRQQVARGDTGRNAPRRSSAAGGVGSLSRRYCHVHGYEGHFGRSCRVMSNANLSAPGSYAQAQITALDHHACGGSQSNF